MENEIVEKDGVQEFDVIYSETVRSMRNLGTWKDEFQPSVVRYCEMRLQYKMLMERWYDGGCVIAEEYTNKAGATNVRKTALYIAIESLRRELHELESDLGLTPIGLRRINDMLKNAGKKTSAFGEAIRALSEQFEE